jgi:hypothetical protein
MAIETRKMMAYKNNGSNWKHTLKDERVIGKTTWTNSYMNGGNG